MLYFLYNYDHGHRSAEKLKEQTMMDVEIIFSNTSHQPVQGKKIGANAAFLFILDSVNQVRVIPKQSSVEQIRYEAN